MSIEFSSFEIQVLESIMSFIKDDSQIEEYRSQLFGSKGLTILIGMNEDEPPDPENNIIIYLASADSDISDEGLIHKAYIGIGHRDDRNYDELFIESGNTKILEGFQKNSNFSEFVGRRVSRHLMKKKLGKVKLFKKFLFENNFPVFSHQLTLQIEPPKFYRGSLLDIEEQ